MTYKQVVDSAGNQVISLSGAIVLSLEQVGFDERRGQLHTRRGNLYTRTRGQLYNSNERGWSRRGQLATRS